MKTIMNFNAYKNNETFKPLQPGRQLKCTGIISPAWFHNRKGCDKTSKVSKNNFKQEANKTKANVNNKESKHSIIQNQSWTPPHAVYTHKKYSIRPSRIEDYEPGKSSIALQDPQAVFSSNFVTENPGDRCQYTENDAEIAYMLQKSLESIGGNTTDVSGHRLYMSIQNGGDIPLTGLNNKLHYADEFSLLLQKTRRRHSDACLFLPQHKRDVQVKKQMKPCLLSVPATSPVTPHSPIPNMSISSLMSCDEVKDRKSRDEINLARKKEMEFVLKKIREKKKLSEEEDRRSRQHADVYRALCISPISMDRYNFDDERSSSSASGSCQSRKSVLRARVLYNFQAKHSRELPLSKDDVVYIWRTVDDNWFEGEHHGSVGMFPICYVEVLSNDKVDGQLHRVKFNFDAQHSQEVSLKKGDWVRVIGEIDENWFQIENNGQIGMVPASYLHPPQDFSRYKLWSTKKESASDDHSNTGSTDVSGSISTESLLKPNGNSQHTDSKIINAISSIPASSVHEKMHSENDLSFHQEANENASKLLPYVECITTQSYHPQEVDELRLKEGDVVHVTEIFNDGWFVGISERTNQCGTFPGICVRRL